MTITAARSAVTLSELAARLGVTPAKLTPERRERMHRQEGLPRPISSFGHPRWERSGIEAWLTRFHPARPPRAANDVAEPLVPNSLEEARQRLHDAYGGAARRS